MSDEAALSSELARQELLLGPLRSKGDPGPLASCLLRLAELYGEKQQASKARALFEEAAPLLQSSKDTAGLARCWYGLGVVEAQVGGPEASAKWMEQAALAFRTAGDDRGEATARACLGETWAFAGHPDRALPQYEQALSFFRQLEDDFHVSSVLMSVGELYADRGQDEEARLRFAEALPLIHRMGDKLGQAVCLLYLGETELRSRAARQAQEHLDKAVAQLEAQGLVDLVPRALHQAGLARAMQSDVAGAEKQLREAISRFEARGSKAEARRVEEDLLLLTQTGTKN